MEETLTRGSRRRAVLGCLATLVAALTLAAPAAHGEALQRLPNWPELLPSLPNTPSGTISPGFDVCPSGAASCPQTVIDEMTARWRHLDASCDHRAVFALTYLRTTEEFARTINGDPSFFSDDPWIRHEDAIFGQLYFNAFDNWQAGDRAAVPAAWRIAFSANATGNVTALGDLLLGMNAHINRDLPYTLAAVGLVKPDGSSRKRDHDLVNAFLDRVIDPLQIELGRRYDPLITLTDAEPSPLDETTALAGIRALRENAWRNAERLVRARTPAARRRVSASIEAESAAFALTILAADSAPGYGAIRDAYCAAHH